MCHRPTSQPPLPPRFGNEGKGRSVVLVAADGKQFGAFDAPTDIPRAPGVVILPDVRGLHPFYEQLALRFSEAGVQAVAIDYYGRTAGIGRREDGFDFESHLARAMDETVALDVTAAVAHLRSEGSGATSVFTVGFCFGGRISLNQAATGLGLAGVIGFYGRLNEEEPRDPTAPVVQAARYACPVLGLFGGADPKITAEHVEGFRRALDAAGVPNEIVVYEAAPHSFFDRASPENEAASADAWDRVLAFIRRNTSRI